ncbi:hypothetical protein JCM8202v2_003471 [Rhodotorula sphaerocarpa]
MASTNDPQSHTAGASERTPADYQDAFSLPIPVPTLKHSFRLCCDLEAVRNLGEGVHGDGGQRVPFPLNDYFRNPADDEHRLAVNARRFNWVNFTGGHFEGTWGHGEIVAGGQDAQHLMPASHPSFPLAANVSTRYLLKTSDGVFIQVQTRGWRTGPKDVLQRLSDAARAEGTGIEPPGPHEYKFRLEIEMETDAKSEKYAWLNTAMWIGAGVRSGRQVLYDAYLVE